MTERMDEIREHLDRETTSPLFLLEAARWLVTEVDRLRKVEVQYELIPGYLRYTGPDPTPNPRPVDRELTRAQEAGIEPF